MKKKILISILTFFTLMSLIPVSQAGKSKPWRANNHTDQDVKVFWEADGCAGVKPHCDSLKAD
ncbi:MAG: hypothetical protein V2J55_03515, partial [Candidatus Competibacteraceae bacterium]|nr:hypothetical protein [Candidatus Competibacteraceae bacterium]